MTLDLPALLQTPAEDALRELVEAADDRTAAGAIKLPTVSSSADRRKARKLRGFLKQGLRAHEAGDDPAAAEAALAALDLDEDDVAANHLMALSLDRLGHVSRALDFYERAWRRDPDDPSLFVSMGLAAWKLDMMEAAEKFFRWALQRDPANAEARVNLSGVLRDTARFEDAIEILREGIYAAPEDVRQWNALGTVLLHAGDPQTAQTFYDEVLRLDPNFARGWHNLSYALTTSGDAQGALHASQKALAANPGNTKDIYEMKHSQALSLLGLGRLDEGWRAYEIRLDKAHGPALFQFSQPRLDPFDAAPLTGQTVLVVGEQGVGDEVLHFNALPDLQREVGAQGRLLIACEKRLVPLIARSFPDAHVQRHGSLEREGRQIRGAMWVAGDKTPDVWTPSASLMGRYRPAKDAFPQSGAFLTPDAERVAAFRRQLEALGPEPKIGLCWKSKKMTATRQKYFSPFEQWRPILETPGVTFVSMQYGDVDDELALAQERHGVTIHQLDDLDLMNDLDGVAAAGAALDLTIGPMNASTNLAGAAGGLVWIIALKTHWPLLGGETVPFYTGSRAFPNDSIADWSDAITRVGAALNGFAQERAAA